MLVTYKSRFLTRAEVWYDDEPGDTPGVDWILYHHRSQAVPGTESRHFYTYALDLQQPVEQLQARLNKDTAYKIRRARERDGIVCECVDPRQTAVIDEFEQMYNTFARHKGLAPLVRARSESLAAAGVLDLSVARDPQGRALVYHANYRAPHRATSLELPSLYRDLTDSAARNLIGRANRYLTWTDIVRYREQGLACFDFGGWYHGTDPGLLKINDFKKGFGGRVLREYQCEQILTLKAWAALRVARWLNRARPLPAGGKETSASDPAPCAPEQVSSSAD